MKKYLLVLVLLFPFITKADTQVFGFMNGNFYDTSGKSLAICFMDNNCLKSDGTTVTLSQFLGLSTSIPQTVTVVTGTPTPPETIYIPVYINQPINSPIVAGNSPSMLPPYTEQQLIDLIGINGFLPIQNKTQYPTETGFNWTQWPPTCQTLSITFQGQTVLDKDGGQTPYGHRTNALITGLTSGTTYDYNFVYTESGREDTVITKSFTTP